MRQQEDFFADDELKLVYIAKRLKEAQRLEELLTNAGIDFLVEPDEYVGGLIFRSKLIGAFFYVPIMRVPETLELLRQHRYKPYQPQDE